MIELHSPRRERKVRHGTSPQPPSNGHHGWRDNAAWGATARAGRDRRLAPGPCLRLQRNVRCHARCGCRLLAGLELADDRVPRRASRHSRSRGSGPTWMTASSSSSIGHRWTRGRVGVAAGCPSMRRRLSTPAHGLGVHRSDTTGADEPSWGGYVGAGGVDVYVADDSRDLVVGVLDSVRDE
jgi:hypothetical protein